MNTCVFSFVQYPNKNIVARIVQSSSLTMMFFIVCVNIIMTGIFAVFWNKIKYFLFHFFCRNLKKEECLSPISYQTIIIIFKKYFRSLFFLKISGLIFLAAQKNTNDNFLLSSKIKIKWISFTHIFIISKLREKDKNDFSIRERSKTHSCTSGLFRID